MYGQEIIIDLKNADATKFNRVNLGKFLDKLCLDILEVRPQERHWWDDENVPLEERQTDPKTKGTTVVQFLLFSNVTIHTLDILHEVYINVFVCRDYSAQKVIDYCKEFFNTNITKVTVLERG